VESSRNRPSNSKLSHPNVQVMQPHHAAHRHVTRDAELNEPRLQRAPPGTSARPKRVPGNPINPGTASNQARGKSTRRSTSGRATRNAYSGIRDTGQGSGGAQRSVNASTRLRMAANAPSHPSKRLHARRDRRLAHRVANQTERLLLVVAALRGGLALSGTPRKTSGEHSPPPRPCQQAHPPYRARRRPPHS